MRARWRAHHGCCNGGHGAKSAPLPTLRLLRPGTITNIFTPLSDCRHIVRLEVKSPEPAMSEIIAIIAVLLAAAIAVVLFLASRKPDTLRVQRAAAIHAP